MSDEPTRATPGIDAGGTSVHDEAAPISEAGTDSGREGATPARARSAGTFSGRMTPSEFLLFTTGAWVFGAYLLGVSFPTLSWSNWVHLLVALGLLGFTVLCLVWRFHDFSVSGWYAYLVVAFPYATRHLRWGPLLFLAAWLAIALWPGTKGPNRYGPQPGQKA